MTTRMEAMSLCAREPAPLVRCFNRLTTTSGNLPQEVVSFCPHAASSREIQIMFNQIPVMKHLKILSLLALLGLVVSCSKDDDPDPGLENAALSFSQDQQILQVPQGLLESEDPNAQEAAAWIAMANGMSANLMLFTPPAGAAKSTELIVAANGRTTSTSGVVYTWADEQFGKIAYQIIDDSDKYTFELFYQGLDDTEWYRYLYAEERKDRSQGNMVMYDAWGIEDDTRAAELFRWEWTRKGDLFTFKMSSAMGAFNFTAEINTKTKAGSIVYFAEGLKQSEITWNAQGAGSWKHFDESGAVVEEGTWS